ncbi:MAG: pentapeptide repeat-containing protein [Myxococcota bacterium]|jgi:tetratricopeptide (TPR) repeat protein|nr:pentapeptide repeat-containing protein [Myxococcota bacterium]
MPTTPQIGPFSRLCGLSLDGLTLPNTKLWGVRFEGCSLQDAVLCDCDLRAALFLDCDLSRARLNGARLDGATLLRVRGSADWTDASFVSCVLHEVDDELSIDAEASAPPPIQQLYALPPEGSRQTELLLRFGRALASLVLHQAPALPNEQQLLSLPELERELLALTEAAPHWYRPWSSLGRVWKELGDLRSAAWAFEQAARRCPEDLYCTQSAANAFIQCERPENAIRLCSTLRAARALNPEESESLARSELIALLGAQRFREADSLCRRFIPLTPDDPWWLVQHALLARISGETALAWARLAEGAKRRPSFDLRLAQAELCAAELGIPQRAISILQHLSPASPDEQARLAKMLEICAQALNERFSNQRFPLLSRAHESLEASLQRAYFLERAGLFEAALDAIPDAAQNDPNSTAQALRTRCALALAKPTLLQDALEALSKRPLAANEELIYRLASAHRSRSDASQVQLSSQPPPSTVLDSLDLLQSFQRRADEAGRLLSALLRASEHPFEESTEATEATSPGLDAPVDFGLEQRFKYLLQRLEPAISHCQKLLQPEDTLHLDGFRLSALGTLRLATMHQGRSLELELLPNRQAVERKRELLPWLRNAGQEQQGLVTHGVALCDPADAPCLCIREIGTSIRNLSSTPTPGELSVIWSSVESWLQLRAEESIPAQRLQHWLELTLGEQSAETLLAAESADPAERELIGWLEDPFLGAAGGDAKRPSDLLFAANASPRLARLWRALARFEADPLFYATGLLRHDCAHPWPPHEAPRERALTACLLALLSMCVDLNLAETQEALQLELPREALLGQRADLLESIARGLADQYLQA